MNTCPACGEEVIEGAEVCENCQCDLAELARPRAKTPLDRSLHKVKVAALRPHDPVIVPAHRKVQDVLASLVLHRDGCAVVVDDEQKIIGIFSERDLLMKIAGVDHAKMDGPVSDVMTPDPVTIESDVPIAYALHQMDLGGYRHLPLVKDGKAVGMISIRDIVTLIGTKFLSTASE